MSDETQATPEEQPVDAPKADGDNGKMDTAKALEVLAEHARQRERAAMAEIQAVLQKHGLTFAVAATLTSERTSFEVRLVPTAQRG